MIVLGEDGLRLETVARESGKQRIEGLKNPVEFVDVTGSLGVEGARDGGGPLERSARR